MDQSTCVCVMEMDQFEQWLHAKGGFLPRGPRAPR
jgi:hypothetical protein